MYNKYSFFSKKLLFLNAILTFLIVLLHSSPLERFGLDVSLDYPLIYCIVTLSHIGVPLFFFISALLFYRNCNYCILKRKLYSRIYSLLIPYLLWNIIFVSIYFFITRVPIIEEQMNMGKVIDNWGSFCIAVLDSRFTPLWFVRNLIIYCLFSPLILFILKRKWLSIIVFLFFIVITTFWDFSYKNIITWVPIYILGAIVGRFLTFKENQDKGSTFRYLIKSHRCRLIVSFSLFIIWVFIYVNCIIDNKYLYLYRLSSPIIIWIIIDLQFYNFINCRFAKKKWMEYTFFIYCTHYFVLNVLQKIATFYVAPTKVYLNIIFVMSPIVTILFLTYLGVYLSRFNFYKYLSGNR